MTTDNGLLSLHINHLMALAVFATDGEDVSERVKDTVARALEQFSIVTAIDKVESIKALRARLRGVVETTHESQPKYRETLEYAISLLPEN